MKQLDFFLSLLNKSDFEYICNWQTDTIRANIQHYSIIKCNSRVNAIVHIYEGDNGFSLYIETQGNSMEKDIQFLNELCNGNE